MSEKFNDGGAAFPCEADGGCGPWEGMTLRDYFAGRRFVMRLPTRCWPNETSDPNPPNH